MIVEPNWNIMKRQGGYDVCRTKFKLFSRGMTKTSLSSQMLPLSIRTENHISIRFCYEPTYHFLPFT